MASDPRGGGDSTRRPRADRTTDADPDLAPRRLGRGRDAPTSQGPSSGSADGYQLPALPPKAPMSLRVPSASKIVGSPALMQDE